jgi:hypothetical protein
MHAGGILDEGVRCGRVETFAPRGCYRQPGLASITKHPHDLPDLSHSDSFCGTIAPRSAQQRAST